jgi:hypothetical protein
MICLPLQGSSLLNETQVITNTVNVTIGLVPMGR